MKIALVTLYYPNYRPLAELVLPNWCDYCYKHGYGMFTHCGDWPAPVNQIGFQKLSFLYNLMNYEECRYDAFAVLDLDVIFTNLTKRIEDFMDDSHDYFVTTGFNGLCNGSFVVKNNEGGKEVVKTMLENRHGHNNEQDTLKYHLDEEPFASRVRVSPYTDFGSFRLDLYPEHGEPTRERGNWQKGDFLLHLAGLELDRRLEVTQEMLKSENIVR